MSRNILLHMGYTLIVTIVLNVLVYFIGNALGITWATPNGPVALGIVVGMSALAAVLGCIGYWICGFLFGDNQRIWFIWLATIIGIISMIMPWTGASDVGSMVFLGLMHVVAVMVMTWYLGVWTPTYIAAEDVASATS